MSISKKTLITSTAIIMAACQPTNPPAANQADNDWCISGGPIYTAIDSAPRVAAVAVKDGIITHVGEDSGDWCRKNAGQQARIYNLQGSAMYPGFTDAHGHLLGIGLREMTLNLDDVNSIAELQSRVGAVVKDTPKGQTIYGRGWIETHWPEERFPNRLDLDKISPENPVILQRADGHAVVVNSYALEKADINKNTPNPFGGDILKDDSGEPNGMLIDNAGNLVSSLMDEITIDKKKKAYTRGAKLYASRGWTNIHSMSVAQEDIALLNTLADEGTVKIRVYNSVDLLDEKSMPSMTSHSEVDNSTITTRAIKLYADGALGSRGAALLSPYSDDPANDGLMMLKEVQANSILEAALRNGTQVNTHAIGDKANRLVLQWYKDAFEAVPEAQRANADPRWRIEHSQIIHVDDIPLFAKYGIIPSMQPSHAIGDLHFAVDRLGKDRLAGGYAWRSLIDNGSIVAGGSDAPVEVGDPRIEYYAATVRKDLKGFSNESWYPEQKVTPQEALKMFTAWPAYAAFEEDRLGTIAVGKLADFTVFDTDLMTAGGDAILAANPVLTIVNGEVAFER